MSNESRAHYRDELTGKHIHRFVRIRDDRITLWRCANGDCSFTLYKKQELMLVGRETFCWNCDNRFKMSLESLQADLPHCPACNMTDDDRAIAALLEQEISERNKSA